MSLPFAGLLVAAFRPLSGTILGPAPGQPLASATDAAAAAIRIAPSGSAPAHDPLHGLLPLAGFGGAKLLLLIVVIALPLILVIGSWLRRSRPR